MIWVFSFTILLLICLMFWIASMYDLEPYEPEETLSEHKTYELKERYKWLRSNMEESK